MPQTMTKNQASDLVFNSLVKGDFDHLPRVVLNRMPTWLMTERLTGPYRSLDRTQGRDLDVECGYPKVLRVEDYKQAYDRVSLAHRVVNIWPDECWAAHPDLYEDPDPANDTAFETAFDGLERQVNLWHFLHRVDRLSRIGYFGALLYGFKGDLATPAYTVNVDGSPRANTQKQSLMYVRAFPQGTTSGQGGVRVLEWEDDSSNPRFGQPSLYEIDVGDPAAYEEGISGPGILRKQVHWTRVQHVADNREASEVFGVPSLRPVFNDVLDVRKVSGSSAEMFFKGGFPGYQFVTNPDMTGEVTVDPEAVRDEVAGYMEGLQRYLTAVGGEWKSLATQVADPSKNVDSKLQIIAATIGVPVRILTGTEAGHLASTQDAGTWKERLRGRQLNYLEPMVLRPCVDRLIDAGVLPRPEKGYFVTWRDLRTLGDKDRADVFLKQVQGLMQYVTGDVFEVFPLKMLFVLSMGLTDEQADSVIRQLGGEAKVKDNLRSVSAAAKPKTAVGPAAEAGSSGGNQAGNPGATAGRPPGKIEGQA